MPVLYGRRFPPSAAADSCPLQSSNKAYERDITVCHHCYVPSPELRLPSLNPISLQSSNEAYERDADRLLTIATSFQCREVEA